MKSLKMVCLLILSVVIITGCAASVKNVKDMPVSQAVAENETSNNKEKDTVCRYEAAVGTSIKKRRCWSREVFEKMQDEANIATRNSRSGTGGSQSTKSGN